MPGFRHGRIQGLKRCHEDWIQSLSGLSPSLGSAVLGIDFIHKQNLSHNSPWNFQDTFSQPSSFSGEREPFPIVQQMTCGRQSLSLLGSALVRGSGSKPVCPHTKNTFDAFKWLGEKNRKKNSVA